jgi:tRNA pseudouridine55 synthase
VLPIAVGKATRLLQYLSHEKSYRAVIRFGITTKTDDLQGAVLSQAPVPELTLEQVQQVLPQFIGSIAQVPPSYSAIQVGGQRLYDLARSGQIVTAPTRTVHIHRIEVLAWRSGEFPELEVAIDCGTGTYIRSIARDWGAQLGCGGTLASLVRTASSGFDLNHSLTLEQVAEQLESDRLQLISPEAALQHLPVIWLTEPQIKLWQQGQRLDCATLVEPPDLTALAVISNPSPPCLICRSRVGDPTSLPLLPATSIESFLGIGQIVTPQSDHQAVQWLIPKLVFMP